MGGRKTSAGTQVVRGPANGGRLCGAVVAREGNDLDREAVLHGAVVFGNHLIVGGQALDHFDLDAVVFAQPNFAFLRPAVLDDVHGAHAIFGIADKTG